MFQLTGNLIAENDSNDPFALLDLMDVKMFFLPMQGINGIYKEIKGIPMVFLNNNLSEQNIRFVAAHELGHFILHREMNRFFLDRCTLLKSSVYESQADLFAACLLFPSPGDIIEEGDTFERLSNKMGVSIELAQTYFEESIK